MIAIRSRKHVVLYALIVTSVATGATSGFVHLATSHILPGPAYRFAMLLATGLPLVIAAPISVLALTMLRIMTLGLDKIEAFVKFDALTAVLARSYFMEEVRRRFGDSGAFMLIDADHFKTINDRFGHDVGDEALRTIGRVLNATAPHEAMIGRLGGEEFGLFFPGARADDARALAEAICRAIQTEGLVIAGKPVKLTLSIGCAMIEPQSTLTVIFKEADEALYSAKKEGRDRYVFGRDTGATPVAFRKTA